MNDTLEQIRAWIAANENMPYVWQLTEIIEMRAKREDLPHPNTWSVTHIFEGDMAFHPGRSQPCTTCHQSQPLKRIRLTDEARHGPEPEHNLRSRRQS